MDNDEILKLCKEAGFTNEEMKVLTYTKWKDGLDIDVPIQSLVRLIELVKESGQL